MGTCYIFLCISKGRNPDRYLPSFLPFIPSLPRTNEIEDALLALATPNLKARHVPLEGMLGTHVD